ncbi:MAG: hypothetical protein GY716_24420, partial [bacterium]|nr:hypothetical protein [bacterium]
MTKFTRFSLAIAGLLVVAALVQPVFAACGSFATLTTIPQAGGRSYIWNEDVFTPGYAYPPYVIAYTPPVTPNLMATWWRLGSGDPTGGVGDDIGGFDAVGSGAVYFYGPGSYGSYFGANLFTGWGADPGIDGCIGAANSCTCLLLVDQNGTDMQLALVGGRSDATQSTAFAQPGNDGSGNAAPIILKNVGKPTLTTLRVAGTNVDIQASLAPLQGIYDPTACDCQNGAVVRYYTQKVGRGGAA